VTVTVIAATTADELRRKQEEFVTVGGQSSAVFTHRSATRIRNDFATSAQAA